MSAGGPGRREVAHRLFAAEYDDASLEYAESDEERAPNYVVTPSGARVNRLFVVGVLTAVEQVNEDTVRARIADPTGVFVVYAGQYQPDELAALQSLESPAFVAVTGKANTFSPEGSDRVLTSVRPERVTEVDAETRDRWVVATAEHTLARIQTIAGALQREERGEGLRAALLREGVEPGFAEGVAKALDHYDTTADYLGALRDLATQALEVVADERSEVEALEIAPDDGDGTVSAGDLTALLPGERQSATEAAEDVDPEVLLESDASGAGEPAIETEGDAADGADAAGGADAEEAADADGAADADQAADAADGADADGAADADEASDADEDAVTEPEPADEPEPEGTAEHEPETTESAESTESAIEETTGDADASAETPEPDESVEADATDELYEVDEEEREQIEEEYGVEFQSGTEVDPAGEADIETEDEPPASDEAPGGQDAAESEASVETDEESESDDDGALEEDDASDEGAESDESDDSDEEADAPADEEAAEDVDVEGAVLAEMKSLDDGDGADREALVDAVADETGAAADAIDDAIDDLLMSGQCYEPSEGHLKPI